jgi:hypothetical protein
MLPTKGTAVQSTIATSDTESLSSALRTHNSLFKENDILAHPPTPFTGIIR